MSVGAVSTPPPTPVVPIAAPMISPRNIANRQLSQLPARFRAGKKERGVMVFEPAVMAQYITAFLVEYPPHLLELHLRAGPQAFARDTRKRALQVPKLLGILQPQVMPFPIRTQSIQS